MIPSIERGIPRTLSLAIGSAILWLVCGVTIGVLSGLYQGRWLDRSLTVVALGGVSIPIFWLGAVLLYLLTFKWHSNPLFGWIPSGGYVPISQRPGRLGVAPVPAVDRAGGRLDRLLLAGGAQLAAGHAAPGLHPHRPLEGHSPSGGC